MFLKKLLKLSDNARRKADEAKAKHMWLFCPKYKLWYTPEELKHIFNYANASEEFLQQLQIRDPREGIDAGFQRLTETQNKLKIFSEKVFEYYKK